jgi:hypothetical protein
LREIPVVERLRRRQRNYLLVIDLPKPLKILSQLGG